VLVLFGIHLWGKSTSKSTNHPPTPIISLAAVGDILLDRGVGKKIEKYGTGYPFERVAPALRGADLAFGNLECPIGEKGRKVVKPFSFQAKPRTAGCLTDGGLDLLSLANNHSLDCGRTGLSETMEILRAKGLHWCGAGNTQAEAEKPTVLSVKGLRIAFVGFCEFLPEGVFLRDDRPTIAFAGEDRVRAAVAAARRDADLVVASFHWGIEYRSRPSARQIGLARAAVDAGADLVLGHHPHVLEALEVVSRAGGRRPALIIYSLGNFVFDQRRPPSSETVILRCTLGRDGVTAAAVTPIRIEENRPRPTTPAEGERLLERLAGLSKERNTILTEGRVALD
jgi:poly-gamma-glutamate synthesis protein (capsule biosynthesis protein)